MAGPKYTPYLFHSGAKVKLLVKNLDQKRERETKHLLKIKWKISPNGIINPVSGKPQFISHITCTLEYFREYSREK